jgi:hypothetical protein
MVRGLHEPDSASHPLPDWRSIGNGPVEYKLAQYQLLQVLGKGMCLKGKAAFLLLFYLFSGRGKGIVTVDVKKFLFEIFWQ